MPGQVEMPIPENVLNTADRRATNVGMYRVSIVTYLNDYLSGKSKSEIVHYLLVNGRRKYGGRNVKPPRKDHQERNNSFSAFPKRRSPGRAGLGYAPPSIISCAMVWLILLMLPNLMSNLEKEGEEKEEKLNPLRQWSPLRLRRNPKRGLHRFFHQSLTQRNPFGNGSLNKLNLSCSSSQFCDNGYWVKQFLYGSDVNDEDNNVILSERRNGNLYSTVFRSIP
ncbi:hypothetical protein OSB04_028583 [Centaurea solstitialis]|uniref:Uncharacterized protein n=1 Tax=Centaurea solstitialis TaxID=347529 RepID=A0AA38VXW3_9ASTR|nr:hypothetical protein OSB04_028583 [Centaurea solstitialis]